MLNRRDAAIVGAYTGFLAGPFQDMHEFIEEVMERPVWTHEMAKADIPWPYYIKNPIRAVHFAIDPHCPYSNPANCPREHEVARIIEEYEKYRGVNE